MRRVPITEAVRTAGALLARVESDGAAFAITRGDVVVAELRPSTRPSGRDVKALIRRHGPDPAWRAEIERVRAESASA
jgi:antitoxin (DNA-binding transcriptional repressor) of toxin-antitoxin stability system